MERTLKRNEGAILHAAQLGGLDSCDAMQNENHRWAICMRRKRVEGRHTCCELGTSNPVLLQRLCTMGTHNNIHNSCRMLTLKYLPGGRTGPRRRNSNHLSRRGWAKVVANSKARVRHSGAVWGRSEVRTCRQVWARDCAIDYEMVSVDSIYPLFWLQSALQLTKYKNRQATPVNQAEAC